jgi:preprotein translocase subunit YajC
MTMLPTLFAQTAAGSPAGPSPIGSFVMFGSIFAIFYFLVIRPQSKQRKDHESKVMSIKKGDQVVTAGGIVGEVLHIKEGLKDGQPVSGLGDHVTIRSGESKLVVTRGRIAAVGGDDAAL